MPQAKPKIDVRIEAGRRKYSSVRLKRAAAYFIKKLKRPHAVLSVYLVDDRKIRVLNRKYLRHDRATDLNTEVLLYLCHGILHLMGYRDKKKADYRKMWAKQRKLLAGMGILLK